MVMMSHINFFNRFIIMHDFVSLTVGWRARAVNEDSIFDPAIPMSAIFRLISILIGKILSQCLYVRNGMGKVVSSCREHM